MRKLIDSQMIGKTIKSLRIANNLTQSELADLVCYSVRNIRRIENEGTTSIDVVNTFADIFEVSALDILEGCFYFAKIKKHWRSSPYNVYSNLLFIHIHARLSYKLRPNSFQNGLTPDYGKRLIIFQLSESFSFHKILFYVGFLLLEPIKPVIDDYSSSSQTLPLRTELLGSQANNLS